MYTHSCVKTKDKWADKYSYVSATCLKVFSLLEESNSDTSLQFDTMYHDYACDSSSEVSVSSASSSVIQTLLSNVAQKNSSETVQDDACAARISQHWISREQTALKLLRWRAWKFSSENMIDSGFESLSRRLVWEAITINSFLILCCVILIQYAVDADFRRVNRSWNAFL